MCIYIYIHIHRYIQQYMYTFITYEAREQWPAARGSLHGAPAEAPVAQLLLACRHIYIYIYVYVHIYIYIYIQYMIVYIYIYVERER